MDSSSMIGSTTTLALRSDARQKTSRSTFLGLIACQIVERISLRILFSVIKLLARLTNQESISPIKESGNSRNLIASSDTPGLFRYFCEPHKIHQVQSEIIISCSTHEHLSHVQHLNYATGDIKLFPQQVTKVIR